MIDHVSVAVSDLGAGGELYDAILEPLGLRRLVTRETAIGYGKRYPEFWLNHRAGMKRLAADSGAHLCLRAEDEAAVVAFHAEALRRGCRDGGKPGFREGTMTRYFAAFILDPDGNRIEAANFPRPG